MSSKRKAVKSAKKVTTKKVVKKASIANRVAEATGYSVSHVANVLAGRRNNDDIIRIARKFNSRKR